jgi:hypothetical protein
MSEPNSPRTNEDNQNQNQNQTQNQNQNQTQITSINSNIIDITTIVNGNTGSITTIEGNVIVNDYITNPIFSNVVYSNTFVNGNVEIIDTMGSTINGNFATQSTFNTIDPTLDTQITQNLVETVDSYYNDSNNSQTALVMSQIRNYASKIQCSDFHGKGSIDDYSELFRAAAKIANDSKQIKLDVDVSGFTEFSQAADDLSNLFNSFIIKLQNVSIINDLDFLTSISIALQKIWNLSETFGRFKHTILATSSIQIPKSAHDTKIILEGVIGEVNCAMNYINHFVNPGTQNLPAANLSLAEHDVINRAVSTIDNWNVLCDQGVSIAMSSNPDIQYITQSNDILKNQTNNLRTATSSLRTKLSLYNINRSVNINITN